MPVFKLTDDEAKYEMRKGLINHGVLPISLLTRLMESSRKRTRALLDEMEEAGIVEQIEVYYRTQACKPVVHYYYRLSTGRTDDIVLPKNPPDGSIVSLGTHSFVALKEHWETVNQHTPILEYR